MCGLFKCVLNERQDTGFCLLRLNSCESLSWWWCLKSHFSIWHGYCASLFRFKDVHGLSYFYSVNTNFLVSNRVFDLFYTKLWLNLSMKCNSVVHKFEIQFTVFVPLGSNANAYWNEIESWTVTFTSSFNCWRNPPRFGVSKRWFIGFFGSHNGTMTVKHTNDVAFSVFSWSMWFNHLNLANVFSTQRIHL